MITMKQWMDLVQHRVTEGSAYTIECYGPNAHVLDAWDGDQEGVSSSIVFDTVTQVVYEVSICEFKHDIAYRLVNPTYADALKALAGVKGGAWSAAYDGVEFTDFSTVDAFIEAASVLLQHKVATMSSIELNLEDDLVYSLMKMAHERDITFNQLITEILLEYVDKSNT